ncbi:alpha-L-fucosidase [Bacteroidota bacterium]
MKKLLILLFALGLMVSNQKAVAQEPYEANWSSLRRHTTPEWLDGMKFGIYCHWGPQSVKISTEDWDMSTLEAIEQWKGENFSAKAWVDLFQAAGAQFAGPVAWHGSGMVNWDSEITDWNSLDKSPGIDITGELTKELRKRNMPVLASFHSFSIWGPVTKGSDVYLDPAADNSSYYRSQREQRSDETLEGIYQRITEAIDKYELDMVWLDTGFGGTVGSELRGDILNGRLLDEGDNSLRGIREDYQQKLISYFYNKGLEWGKDVEFIYKSFDIPPGIGMRDIENGNLKGLQYDPWMADINMAYHWDYRTSWFYNTANPMKDANTLVDMLIDVTSKNGRILLSVPPKRDGTFSEDQVKQLTAMGDWLKLNSEAIYGTIPWVFFGEGPTEVIVEGHHAQSKFRGDSIPHYTAKDIRFTQKDNYLYAICLDWPGEELSIRTLGLRGKMYPGDIKSITMLGTNENIEWEQTADALVVQFPDTPPCDFAYCLKIER